MSNAYFIKALYTALSKYMLNGYNPQFLLQKLSYRWMLLRDKTYFQSAPLKIFREGMNTMAKRKIAILSRDELGKDGHVCW
jgi:hypothetical protein